MAVSSVAISVTITGNGFSYTYTPQNTPVQNSSAPGAVPVNVALSSGANTINVPSGATGAIIVPPAGSANTKTLKGVTGDTGVALGKAVPTWIEFDTTVTSFVITSGGSETILIAWT